MVQRLLQAASKPYFSMLELWLCQGVLNDPYAEFMVEEDKVLMPFHCLCLVLLLSLHHIRILSFLAKDPAALS